MPGLPPGRRRTAGTGDWLYDLTGGWTTPLLLLAACLAPMTWAGWGAARDAVLATDEQPRAAVRGR